MKIGISYFHVSQGGHLERETVGILTSHGKPAFCLARRLVGFMDAEFLVRAASDGSAIVAAGASAFLEYHF